MKYILFAVLLLAVLVGAFFAFNSYIYNEKQVTTAADYKDAEYIIDGERIKLEDGVAETEVASESALKTTTQYFGNELIADLNDDGRDDVVFILTQTAGASGTFYYVVAALNTEEGYVGSDGYLLGDRIAPQSTELSQNPNHENVVVVNYMDRASREPMVAEPSVGKSVWLKLDAAALQFGVVEQEFEGEANPAQMSLTMKDWTWISTVYMDGRRVEPVQPNQFTLSFTDDGRFSATTDCNGMSGDYTTDGETIAFGPVLMTKMFCESSQESELLTILEHAVRYEFTARGELVFSITLDDGVATFR